MQTKAALLWLKTSWKFPNKFQNLYFIEAGKLDTLGKSSISLNCINMEI